MARSSWGWVLVLLVAGCQLDVDEGADAAGDGTGNGGSGGAGGAAPGEDGSAGASERGRDAAPQPPDDVDAQIIGRCRELDGGQPVSDAALAPPADAAVGPVPDAVPVTGDCATLCGGRNDDCIAACDALRDALAPEHFAGWSACMAAAPADAAPRLEARCLADLDCDAELLVGAHCDALGRCGPDGRGYFAERECRLRPYEEPGLWACLAEDRKAAIFGCLQGNGCVNLEVCLNQSACRGDPACVGLFETTLSIDCYGVCGHVAECGSEYWGSCFVECRNAARLLADEQIRSLESCVMGAACDENGGDLRRLCVGGLECDAPEVAAAAQAAAGRCGNAPDPDAALWACYGRVVQTRIIGCLDDAPCDTLEACVAEATCGDNPGCDAIMQ